MLVSDSGHRGLQGLQIVDIRRVGVDGARESPLLLAPFLVPHVEQILQLGVSLEQAFIEALNNHVAVFGQDRRGGFDSLDGILREHLFPPFPPNFLTNQLKERLANAPPKSKLAL